MQIRIKILGIAFLLVIFVDNFLMANDYELSSDLTWKINSTKNEIFQGEPFLITLSITNTSDKPVSTELSDSIDIFSMEIRTVNDKTVKRGSRILKGGFSLIRKLSIPPHSFKDINLVVNRWCSTDIPSGKYKILCFVHGFSGKSVLTIEHDFEILPANKEELMSIFSGLAAKVISAPSSMERSLASKMLVFADSPLRSKYIMNVVKQEDVELEIRKQAIESLESIADKESAKHIVAICEDDNLSDELRKMAINSAYNLKEKSENEVRAIVDPVVLKHERPFIPIVID